MMMKTEIGDSTTPETNKEEMFMMMTSRMKSREVIEGGNMTMTRKMMINIGLATDTKEALNKREETAIPAIDAMMMKRNSQEDPGEDMRTTMRRKIMKTVGQEDARTAEMKMVGKGTTVQVAEADNAPTSGIMIEIKLISPIFHIHLYLNDVLTILDENIVDSAHNKSL